MPEYKEFSPDIRKRIEGYYSDVRKILRDLPKKITFSRAFDGSGLIIPEYGTGGFAYSSSEIIVAFDDNFLGEKEEHFKNLKATIFHESYHIAQGYNGKKYSMKNRLPAIKEAIYEGAATVFERERANSRPKWGEYLADKTMGAWVKEIQNLPKDYNFNKYKFYDAKTNRRWVLYRTGTFVVDRALKNNPRLQIEDLVKNTPQEILEMANLN